jgi:hypothetical protein
MSENKMVFHGDLDLRKFHLKWFGLQGRELGSTIPHSFGTNPYNQETSHRTFTDNPEAYLQFIDWCVANKAACWITSQPMRAYNTPFGLEKLFFDFDYHLEKNENMTPSKRKKVDDMTLQFIEELDEEPLIVRTRKGNHVYVFLRRIYEFDERNVEFAKEVFGVLCLSRLKIWKVYSELTEQERKKWKYLDFAPLGDIMRMARVPLTPHEKNGVLCQILDRNLEPTKVRDIDLFKAYGLREDLIREAVELVKNIYQKKIIREQNRIDAGAKSLYKLNGEFRGQMRPCFTERLKIGEMKHQQRLALLMEAWWTYHEIIPKEHMENQLLDICRNFKDFDEKISLSQIRWFLKNKAGKIPPYKCGTLKNLGYCLKSECSLYKG